MDNPLVSVVIPVYNGAATIERAITSALAQRLDEPFEVIVVDDGSVDDTAAIVSGYAGQIRTLRQPRGGPSAARNAGAAISRGRYLAFLDADDVWLPNFLKKSTRALADSPLAALAFSDVIAVDGFGRQITDFVNPDEFNGTPTLDNLFERWWPILTSAVVMRREVFERCGGFAEEFRTPGYEDPWLWIKTRECGEFRRLTERLVLYHTTPQLQRIEKYAEGFAIFSRLAKQRYGRAASPLVKHFKRSYVSSLGYKGLLAMTRGDMREARHEFIRALKYDPFSVRSMLRLGRTFLPMRLAIALGGRTVRAAGARSGQVIVSLKKSPLGD